MLERCSKGYDVHLYDQREGQEQVKKSPQTDSVRRHLWVPILLFACLLCSCGGGGGGGGGSSSAASNLSGSAGQNITTEPEPVTPEPEPVTPEPEPVTPEPEPVTPEPEPVTPEPEPVTPEPEPATPEPAPNSGWQPSIFQPARQFKDLCANPRSGSSAVTGEAFPDQRGETLDENNWLRSWVNDTYLWYDEVIDRDPSLYTTEGYFPLLKTEAITASGKAKDDFSYSTPTDEYEAIRSGRTFGYGVTFDVVSRRPPRELVVLYNEPGSPAARANLNRGARILAVDGVDVIYGDADTINAGLFPESDGERHVFTLMDFGSTAVRNITLVSGPITTVPVQQVATLETDTGKVGYLLFNSHIVTAERALVEAVNRLNSEGIDDLVLDLRYNDGGLLAIASQLAYMIAGDTQTNGRVFETLQFNDKHPVFNPVTGDRNDPIPFYKTTGGLSLAPGIPLPTLDLSRLYVLTTANTCSASESIINSLRGIDVEVVLIGSTTCGKPYGFYATDNCGTTYSIIQFRGINDVGFGHYAEGFAPGNASPIGSVPVKGCFVDDYPIAPFRSPDDPVLEAALHYRETGICPPVAARDQGQPRQQKSSFESDALVVQPQGLKGAIILYP